MIETKDLKLDGQKVGYISELKVEDKRMPKYIYRQLPWLQKGTYDFLKKFIDKEECRYETDEEIISREKWKCSSLIEFCIDQNINNGYLDANTKQLDPQYHESVLLTVDKIYEKYRKIVIDKPLRFKTNIGIINLLGYVNYDDIQYIYEINTQLYRAKEIIDGINGICDPNRQLFIGA